MPLTPLNKLFFILFLLIILGCYTSERTIITQKKNTQNIKIVKGVITDYTLGQIGTICMGASIKIKTKNAKYYAVIDYLGYGLDSDTLSYNVLNRNNCNIKLNTDTVYFGLTGFNNEKSCLYARAITDIKRRKKQSFYKCIFIVTSLNNITNHCNN